MKRVFAIIVGLLFIGHSIAQDPYEDSIYVDTTLKANIAFGIELQAYPTGVIPGLIIDATFNNANALIFRLGYNWFNHRSLGVHDSEKGSGLGFSIGYRRYLEEQGLRGFFVGVRTDWWFSSVDWFEHQNDDRNQPELLKSNSDIIVFQPVVELGYKVRFKNQKAAFVPIIGLGYEANISTRGDILPPGPPLPANVNTSEDTGEGFIVLAGFAFQFTISRDD